MIENVTYRNLISDLKNKNVIIWVGAGYSKRLGFPDWKGFVFKIAEKYFENDSYELMKFQAEASKTDSDILKLLAGFDKNKRKVVFDLLPEIFELPYSDPNDSRALPFKKLWRLSSQIITTNYDLSLNEAKDLDCRTVVWNRKGDYKNFIERNEKYLFKLHGTVKDPVNCIIFPDQYDDVYKKTGPDDPEKLTYYFLKHLVTDHKILFIGYGGFKDDVYIDSTFEYVHEIIKSFSDKKHYILKHSNSSISRDYLESIEFENYSDLDLIVDDLLQHVTSYKATSDQIDSFIPEYIGRQHEKEELRKFIESVDSNFLFLWGKGGIGKTHLLKTVLEESKTPYLYFQLISATSLQSLADKLNLGVVIDHNKVEHYSKTFVEAFEKINIPVIFDDFYEIDTKEYPNPKLKNTLLQLKDSSDNKTIIISRALDSTFTYLPNLEIKYLEPEEHEQFVKAYIKYEGSHLSFKNLDETISKIWNASRGYPLVSQIFLDILGQPYAYPDFNLEEFGRFDYEKYDKENNQGKEYVEKLISVVLKGKDEASRELLLNFSLALKEMPFELLQRLPFSNQFKVEQKRKDYIIVSKSDTGEYSFSLHPLVWEIFRKKAGSRSDVQLILGKYYLDKFIDDYDNVEAYSLSEYHYNLSTDEGIAYFNNSIKNLIDKAKIKDILSKNIEATIVRLKLKRGFGNNAAIHHQLATQYYFLHKIPEALNEIELGLRDFEKNEHLLLQKAIIQSGEGQISGAEQALIQLLSINPLNILARNEIGILYREWANIKQGKEKEDKYTEAEKWLKPLAEEKHIHARNEIGILYREWANIKQGKEKEDKYTEAEKWLKPLAEENNVLACNELALLYRGWGSLNFKATDIAKLNLSRNYFEKAIALKKDNIQSYDGLCRTLVLLGDYEECLNWGDAALNVKSYDEKIIKIMIEVCFYNLKNKQKAKTYWDKLKPSSYHKKRWEGKLS